MKTKIVNILGMKLLEVKNKSCVAHFGYNDNEKWITLYDIISDNPGKGEAQELLENIKIIYKDYDFGGTVALNPTMKHIYKKIGIKEFKILI